MHPARDRIDAEMHAMQGSDPRATSMAAIGRLVLAVLLAGLASAGCSPKGPESDPNAVTGSADDVASEAASTEPMLSPGQQCAAYSPQRRAFYGDLHVHTAYSHDAWAFDTRTTPDEAYRFARGEAIRLAPLDAEGRGTRRIQIPRRLDFAAITDHAEYFGPTYQCTNPASQAYRTESCGIYREDGRARSGIPMGADMSDLTVATYRRMRALADREVCEGDARDCRGATDAVWRETIAAAERWNDSSEACEFTALVGYEYSMTPELTKIHRNVIFRSAAVPPQPISWIHEPTPWGLWQRLQSECVDAGIGCDALTIPHNTNLSNGRLFEIEYGEAKGVRAERAAAELRQKMEPLVEIMQIKGDSECRNGMWGVVGSDELCEFEKFDFNVFVPGSPEPPDCQNGASYGALAGRGCLSRRDFVRYALIDGLREADRLGVNPFKVGAIASTDGHDGAPGDVDEYLYDGELGRQLNDFGFNPGGLAGVWAEENSRASLFDAMQRRETFGTSGPRISVRFFGGWDFPEDLCEGGNLVSVGYAQGVPMGADLPPPPATLTDSVADRMANTIANPIDNRMTRAGSQANRSPRFVISALADPGTRDHPGGRLQRIQIVKGWAEGDALHQAIYDIGGDANNAADVDLASCEPRGPGYTTLCGTWRDPDFDPDQRSFYYARVVENPSCRYSARYCLNQPPGEGPAVCTDPEVPKTIQERAWSSPIWYTPKAPGDGGEFSMRSRRDRATRDLATGSSGSDPNGY